MGTRLTPLVTGDRLRWRDAVPTVLLPVQQGVVEVTAGGAPMLLDRSSWMVAPADQPLTATAKSPSAALLVLMLHPEVRDACVEAHQPYVERETLDRLLSQAQQLPRTAWVHEICHRYLFERDVCGKSTGLAVRFLETEIVKELYFICRDREVAGERFSQVRVRSAIVERAVAHIEGHLFESIAVAPLAAAVGASQSTLLRAFHREVGLAPSEYVRQRRLEEAVLLLKAGRYTVSEVATQVGYDNLAAFSHAFRTHFGHTPSAIRARGQPSRANGARHRAS